MAADGTMSDPNCGLRRVGICALLLALVSGAAGALQPTDSGVFFAGMLALVTFAVPACVVGHQLGFLAWQDQRRRRRQARLPIRMRVLLHT